MKIGKLVLAGLFSVILICGCNKPAEKKAQAQPKPPDVVKTESPKIEVPKTDLPKIDSPKEEPPKEDLPKADLPKDEPPKPDDTKTVSEPEKKSVVGCFPTKQGTVWTYKITMGETEPIAYEEVLWPMSEGMVIMANRSRLGSMAKEKKKEYSLVLKIKGDAKKQGGLEYPIGTELLVEKDELQVFFEAKQIFLATTPHGGFMTHRVVTYSSDTPGSPNYGYGTEDGYSMGIVFFLRKPGIRISMGRSEKKESVDSLLFVDIEPIPGTRTPGFHFLRRVLPSEKEGKTEKESADKEDGDAGNLGKGFTEDTWFDWGKGLVYLQQKVDGKVSMTWKLVDFSTPE